MNSFASPSRRSCIVRRWSAFAACRGGWQVATTQSATAVYPGLWESWLWLGSLRRLWLGWRMRCSSWMTRHTQTGMGMQQTRQWRGRWRCLWSWMWTTVERLVMVAKVD